MTESPLTLPSAPRANGLSVRLRLALSYAALVVATGVVLLSVVSLFLLRYIPAEPLYSASRSFVPNRADIERTFIPWATWAMIALVVVGIVSGWFLAGRMLRPLVAMGDAARLVASGSLDHRIAMPGRQDEFRELADVFDAMLARIQDDVERQQRFAANASHELRTPLAITRTLLEVAAADPDPDVPVLLMRLRGANDRAVDLTEALLLLARIEARPPQAHPVDLSIAAEDAAETLHLLADERRVRIGVDATPILVHGDERLLHQLAVNLLQNAITHNLPEGGEAWVSTSSRPRQGTLVIENTGATIDPTLVPTLVEPFQRGAQRVRGSSAGSGLGLAIAQSIVEALDGHLFLSARPEGGLRVEASFPLER